MATVAETLQKRNKLALERGAARPQAPRSFQDMMGLQKRTALQKVLTQREGPQGAGKAPRTSQPQVQKGKRPVQSRIQGLLQTGRLQRGVKRRRGTL
jgi:hypothetical protein